MSDAARLAKQSFAMKPSGMAYANFVVPSQSLQNIISVVDEAALDAAYASVISYAEALAGLRTGSSSWSVIRLYYSCYYSIKSFLLLNRYIPFNCSGEMILDASTGKFLKGGTSSHHWNWHTLRSTDLTLRWFFSKDSEELYSKLRGHRENVSYTHAFTDPNIHHSLLSDEVDLNKRFRAYRDDADFFYTYLDNHCAIAYPTKLLCQLDHDLRQSGISLPIDKISHINSVWKFRERCPIT